MNTTLEAKQKFSSVEERVQFVIDNFQRFTNKEIARIFGWLEEDPKNAISKVKNFKQSIEKKFNISLIKREDMSTINISKIKIPNTIKKIDIENQSSVKVRKQDHGTRLEKDQEPAQKQGASTRHGQTREGYIRHTIIIRNDFLEKIEKKVQKEKQNGNKNKRQILDDIFSSYFDKK